MSSRSSSSCAPPSTVEDHTVSCYPSLTFSRLRTVKYLSPSTSTLIIRVSREHYRTLWAALTLLRRMGGQEVICRVIHVSGASLSVGLPFPFLSSRLQSPLFLALQFAQVVY